MLIQSVGTVACVDCTKKNNTSLQIRMRYYTYKTHHRSHALIFRMQTVYNHKESARRSVCRVPSPAFNAESSRLPSASDVRLMPPHKCLYIACQHILPHLPSSYESYIVRVIKLVKSIYGTS